MKKLLLSFLLVTLFAVKTTAQSWSYYKDFPVNVIPTDIAINNTGTLFMLTQDYKIYYKTLNGQWTNLPISGGAFNPTCITVDSTTNLLLYGDRQSALNFTFNFGTTWNTIQLFTQSESGFSEDVSVLSNMRNGTVYGGGFSQVNENSDLAGFITRYSTTEQPNFFVHDPTLDWDSAPAGLIYTANNKLIIGTDNNGIWITENEGNSFEQTSFDQHEVSEFTEDTSGRVYALGRNTITNQDFMVSSTDYLNWTSVTLPNTNEDYTTIYFDATSNSLWLGSKTNIYKTSISSITPIAWNSANLNNNTPGSIEIIGSNSGRIYNISSQNITQQLNNIQTNWSTINTGLIGTVSNIKFGQNNKLFATSIESFSISSSNSSSDPWVNIDAGNAVTIRSLHTKNNGKIFFDAAYYIKKSLDNGLTYSDITPSIITPYDPNATVPPNLIFRFYVGENNNLYLTGNLNKEKLYWSQDDGATWTLLRTFSENVDSISEDSNGVIYVTTFSSEVFDGVFRIHYTANNGISWNSRTYSNQSLSSSGMGISSINNETFVRIGPHNIFKFNYAPPSNNFTPINIPSNFIPQQIPINQFKANSIGEYYIFGDFLYKSVNQGVSWTNLGKPSQINTVGVDDLIFDSSNKCYIVNNLNENIVSEKGIYTVTENLGIENPSLENQVAVYPNPVQNILNIATKETLKEIYVYDLLCKKVAVNQISPSSIDVSNLTKGIYLIKVIGENDKTFSTKFIKE